MKAKLLLLAGLLFVALSSQATHLNGGYISYRVDSQNPLKYYFTLTISSDDRSMADDPAVIIGMGDLRTVTVSKSKHIPQLNQSSLEIYEWEHTYAAPGDYMVYWIGLNRNPALVNVAGLSDQMTQFIYMQVHPRLVPLNYTSVKTIIPAPMEAFVGEPFRFNMIAYDADGDRLSYELVPPKYLDQNKIPQNLPGYQFPEGMYIDKFGELHWPNPSVKGEYAFSVKITEYKNQQQVGSTIVDMNLYVKDRAHQPIVRLLNKDRLTVNYDGSIFAQPGQLLKLEFYVEKAPNSIQPVYAKQFSDLDTLDLATPTLAARDSANGLAVTLTLTPETSIARNEPYIIGLRGSSPGVTRPFEFGYDFVYLIVGAQQPTSSGVLADEINLQVYPNPTSDKFIIEGEKLRNAQLRLFNSNGKKMLEANLKAGSNLVKRPAGMASGVYVYYIYQAGKPVKSGKLVLK